MALTTIFEKVADLALLFHVIAGIGSIILFWIPILTKKGGKQHRKAGKAYILLMWIVIFSGIVLAIHKYYVGIVDAAIFLGFLVFLAARPIWYGTAILQPNRYSPQELKYYHVVLKLILFVYGIFMLIYSTYLEDKSVALLMVVFGVLGIFAGIDAWRDLTSTSTKVDKIQGHFEGMLFSGVAAYTGFLTIAGYEFISKYMIGYWVLIPWLLPSIIGISLIVFYKKRFPKTNV